MKTVLTIVIAVAISTVVSSFVPGWFTSPMETTWQDVAGDRPYFSERPLPNSRYETRRMVPRVGFATSRPTSDFISTLVFSSFPLGRGLY